MPDTIQPMSFKQGVDKVFSVTGTLDGAAITFDPLRDHAYMDFYQLKRVGNSLEALTYKDSLDLDQLTKRAGEIVMSANSLTITIPRHKSRRWNLYAVDEPIIRSVAVGNPPTVSLKYPAQLVHARLYVINGADLSYILSGTPFEFEVEVTENGDNHG